LGSSARTVASMSQAALDMAPQAPGGA
jgi:hypothetical protein